MLLKVKSAGYPDDSGVTFNCAIRESFMRKWHLIWPKIRLGTGLGILGKEKGFTEG